MARYVREVILNKPDDFVYFMMNDYLQKNSFKPSNWKGAPAYKRGDGFFEMCRYMAWSYNDGVLRLEAWAQGIFVQEQDLSGIWGWGVKSLYKKDIEKLIALLQQTIPEPVPTSDGSAQFQNVIPVQTMDNAGSAIASLVFGILTLCCFWNYLSLAFACISIMFYRSGKGSTKAGLAKAGLICSIVGLVIWAILFILNLFSVVLYGVSSLF